MRDQCRPFSGTCTYAPVTRESPRYVCGNYIRGTRLRQKCDMRDQHEGREDSAVEMGEHDGRPALSRRGGNSRRWDLVKWSGNTWPTHDHCAINTTRMWRSIQIPGPASGAIHSPLAGRVASNRWRRSERRMMVHVFGSGSGHDKYPVPGGGMGRPASDSSNGDIGADRSRNQRSGVVPDP
jgi:hypothetical protein